MGCFILKRIIQNDYNYVMQQDKETISVVFFDYKMKFEQMEFCEKKSVFYDQNDLIWHWCVAQYRRRRTATGVKQEKRERSAY